MQAAREPETALAYTFKHRAALHAECAERVGIRNDSPVPARHADRLGEESHSLSGRPLEGLRSCPPGGLGMTLHVTAQ